MSLTRIGSIGINTGIAFAGVTTIVTLNTANDALSIGATVNVGSGITLGASGDIFATGVSTVTTLKVGSGVTVSSDGDIFATGVTTSTTFSGAFSGSGANITALNASNISSGTVPTARLGSGTASSSTFLRGDSTFQTVNTDLVSDTSPQLGGDLDINGNNITFGDSGSASDDRLTFGAGTDLSIYHDGTNTTFDNNTGQFNLDGASGSAIRFLNNGTYQCQIGSAGLDLPDTKKIRLGDSEDLELQHDGTNNIIKTSTAAEIQINNGGEYMARFIPNGSSILYEDNVRVLQTDDYGIGVYGPEGGLAQILLYSDEGDDNADKWRIINNNSDFLKIQTYKSGSWQDTISAQAENQVRLFYNGSEKLNTTSGGVSITGQLYFNNGNLVFGSSGTGIDFSSTSDGSGVDTSELFDDYEEGTWTPVLPYGNSGTNHNLEYAYYTKIGRQVTVLFYLSSISIPNDSNEFRITGLPYSVVSGHGFGNFGYIHTGNNTDPLFPVFSQGASRIYFHRSDGNTATWKNSDAVSTGMFNSYLLMGGTYFTST